MLVSFFSLIPGTEIKFFFPTTSSSDIEVEAEIAQIPSHISVILQNKIDKTDPSSADWGDGATDCSEFAPRCLRRWPPL